MNKLYFLFLKHLRTIYSGEKEMLKTLESLKKYTDSRELLSLYRKLGEEKAMMLETLQRMFKELHQYPEGEADEVIFSYTSGDMISDSGFHVAFAITGQALNIYQVNAIRSAISCADDLNLSHISARLKDCLKLLQYSSADHHTVIEEFAKLGIETSEAA